MKNKLFLSLILSLASMALLTGSNIVYAQASFCKVNFCNCCHDSGVTYDIYNIADSLVASFTTDTGGCSNEYGAGWNVETGTSWYVLPRACDVHRTYFTACACDEGYVEIKVPCCGGDNPGAFKNPEKNAIPAEFKLFQNYPNPFNPTTNIRFALPVDSYVKLTIYDVSGKKITTLIDGVTATGYHEITWFAGNLASGVYFYKLEAGSFTSQRKMLLVK